MDRFFSKIDGLIGIKGDGNCQFRALSHGLHGSDEYYADVRKCVVEQLKKDWLTYKSFVSDPDTYVQRMQKDGAFGDNITLQAFSDAFKHGVIVINSVGTVTSIKPEGHAVEPEDYVCVFFLSEGSQSHYNAMKPYNAHPTQRLIEMLKNKNFLKIQMSQILKLHF